MPISVIIVGVGNEQFRQMIELDGDDAVLRDSYGTPVARDVVQFVKFKEYAVNPYRLAEEVLKEVPEQLVTFMTNYGIKPAPIQHQNPPL